MNAQLLEYVRIFWIKVEAHLTEPVEGFRADNPVFDKETGHVTLVNQLSDLPMTINNDYDPNLETAYTRS